VPSAVRQGFEISLQASRLVRGFRSWIDALIKRRSMARDVLGSTRCIILLGDDAGRGEIDAFPNAGARDGHRRSGV
jgi:hypothetical protein